MQSATTKHTDERFMRLPPETGDTGIATGSGCLKEELIIRRTPTRNISPPRHMSQIAQTSQVLAAEHMLSVTLLQLALIVAAARLAGGLAVRLSQARAVGEIIVGILLGPSLFGALAPDLFHAVFRSTPAEPMVILSQVGLILLMFQIGMEFDFSLLAARHFRRATLFVAVAGLVCPFALGLGFGYYTAPFLAPSGVNPLIAAMFVGTAFSITALPILGRILMEFDLTRTPLGVIAISAAAINDVVGWLLLAVVTALAMAAFSAAELALRLGALALYAAACWFVVRPLLKWFVGHAHNRDELNQNVLTVLLVMLFLSAIITFKIGIFAIFGGFMLGLLLHDEKELVENWSDKVGQLVQVLFLPIFFTFTGLRTHIGSLDSAESWGWCVLLIALATLGKYTACNLAARLAGQGKWESRILGLMMNTRGLMELIVINIGFDLGVISQRLFTMLVLMALFSTVITTPGLKRWLPRLAKAPNAH